MRMPLSFLVCICAFAGLPAVQTSPGRPDFSSCSKFVKCYSAAAAKIAQRKIDELVKDGLPLRLATGGGFKGYFLWDTAFTVIWAARMPRGSFPAVESLDNFYRFADKSGFINREYTVAGVRVWEPSHPNAFAPPILSWAEMELFRRGHTDTARLMVVYPKLRRHHEFCRSHYRRDDGLYFGDQLGCGMDDLRRYPQGMTTNELMTSGGIPFTVESIGPESKHFINAPFLSKTIPEHYWNRQMGWIDMSAQMALDARMLAEMAELIGRTNDVQVLRAEYAELAAAVNRYCWSDEMCFYGDYYDGKVMPRKSAAAFWVLLAKVATPERAESVKNTLMDERCFFRPNPFPSLSADDVDYQPEKGYWNGPSWPPTTYVAIRGLMEYGYKKEAEIVARRYYNANASLFKKHGTVFENISPEQSDFSKERAQRDFCGWGAWLRLPCQLILVG